MCDGAPETHPGPTGSVERRLPRAPTGVVHDRASVHRLSRRCLFPAERPLIDAAPVACYGGSFRGTSAGRQAAVPHPRTATMPARRHTRGFVPDAHPLGPGEVYLPRLGRHVL